MKSKQPKNSLLVNPWKKILSNKKRKGLLAKGMVIGLVLANLLVVFTASFYYRNYDPRGVNLVLGACYGIAAQLLIGWVVFHGYRLLSGRQQPVAALLVSSLTVCWLVSANFFRFPAPYFWYGVGSVYLTVVAAVVFTLALFSRKRPFKQFLNIAFLLLAVGVLSLSIGHFWLTGAGFADKVSVVPSPPEKAGSVALKDPSADGDFAFTNFTYGSGKDKRRPEYGDNAKYTTPSVDGRRLLPEWKGKKQAKREKYWGFDAGSLPLNGRVWMPEGKGPFPLVLVVHGNHSMMEYSDPGYAYLGEWLASNGMIVVSVDENFLNGAPDGDFRGKEMPARGWLLLKHLEQWRQWNADKGHGLYGKADLSKVVLIGHSRGGEAVSIAAAFNRLPAFPDNALEQFSFGFGIRGVVALAQTDYRYDRRMELNGVSFLALQGSYDSDEDSFYGLRQYRRTSVDDSTWKAGVFIHGANHGQFNTIWGSNDAGPPFSYLLNKAGLIDGEAQRQIARVCIGSFVKSVFFGQNEYQQLFRNKWAAAGWLPETNVCMVYRDGRTDVWEDFEADIDVRTFGAGLASATGLKIWKEELMHYKGELPRNNNALLLGWKLDSTTTAARYSFAPSDELDFTPSHFVFNLSHADTALLEAKKLLPDPDFDIVFEDKLGGRLVKRLSAIHVLAPRAEAHYYKSDKMTKERFNVFWEPQFEYVEMALNSTSIDWRQLKRVSFEFGGDCPTGVVYIDDIGFRR